MKVLVAGLGNIFRGDDAFGVEVAQRLLQTKVQAEVQVVDFGIRGYDFAHALLDGGYNGVIILDAIRRGGRPGTLYLIEPDLDALSANSEPGIEPHSMDPLRVLQWVKSQGGKFEFLRLIACEVYEIGSDEDMIMELSPPVAGAIDEALRITHSVVEQLCMN